MKNSEEIQTLQQKGWNILTPGDTPDLGELALGNGDIVGIITFVKESVCYIKKLENIKDIEPSSEGVKKIYLTYLGQDGGFVRTGAPIK